MAAQISNGPAPVPILEDFTKVFEQWFGGVALPHLANYLTNERKITTTVEELKAIFKLPVHVPQTMSNSIPFPMVMGLPNAVQSSNGLVANGSAAKAPVTKGRQKAPSTGRTCKYRFEKGAHKDEICAKPEIAYEYCKACIGKSGPKEELHGMGITDAQIDALKKGTAVPAEGMPALMGGPAINTIIPTKPALTLMAPPPLQQRPNFQSIDPRQNLYILENIVPGALCVRPDPNQEIYICVGILRQEADGQQKPGPLSPDQERIMKSLNIAYSSSISNNTASPPAAPTTAAPPQSQPQTVSPPLFQPQTVAPPLFPSSAPIASPVASPMLPPMMPMPLGGAAAAPQALLPPISM